jgi:hypothetical protein
LDTGPISCKLEMLREFGKQLRRSTQKFQNWKCFIKVVQYSCRYEHLRSVCWLTFMMIVIYGLCREYPVQGNSLYVVTGVPKLYEDVLYVLKVAVCSWNKYFLKNSVHIFFYQKWIAKWFFGYKSLCIVMNVSDDRPSVRVDCME